MRWLLWKLGFVRLVWLEDYDHSLHLRILRKHPNAKFVGWARRVGLGIRSVFLTRDGAVLNCSYVEHWHWYDGTNLKSNEKSRAWFEGRPQ